MLQPVFDFIEKFSTDFNWRRVVIFVAIIFFTAICFYLYEDLTSTYELRKYERAVSILKDLEELTVSNSQQKLVVNNIFEGLETITNQASSGISIDVFKNENLKLAIISAAPWLLFTLIFIPSWLRGDRESGNVVLGSFVFSLIIGTVGYVLPVHWPNWVRIWGYAVFANLIIIFALIKYGNRNKA